MNYLKKSMYILAEHLAFIIVTLMISSALSFALKSNTGSVILSTITAFLYLSSVYTHYWHEGAKAYRTYKVAARHSEQPMPPFNVFTAFTWGIPSAVIGVSLAVAAFAAGGIAVPIVNVYNLSFMAFVTQKGRGVSLAINLFVGVLPMLSAGFGYMVGKTGFSISEKYLPRLIYAKKNTNSSSGSRR